MGYLNNKQIKNLKFKHVGNWTKISDKASFYNAKNISIGDNTRIDDFCVISAGEGGIFIGNNVHLSIFSSIMGKAKIIISDYAGLSSRVSIYSSNDDYSGNYMTNPTVNPTFTNVKHAPVYIGKHVVIGSGSIVLPDSIIEDGASVGALSLIKGKCKPFYIYAGIPARPIKKRSKKLLKLEQLFTKNDKRI